MTSRVLLWASICLGAAARLFLLFQKPLWADEIFTLMVARRSPSEILAALRVDSGPPLHYLLAHVLILPFGHAPGPQDLLVRGVSVAASLLHLPLFFRIARRLGRPQLGLRAAALFSVFPLAVDYAAEGRAYALASLLVLFAFERALALRERPAFGTGLALALSSAAAVLTHYLALFPVAGLAVLAVRASPPARRALALSGLTAALLVLPWAPVALAQPRASMAWARTEPFARAPRFFFTNLVLGLQPPAAMALPLAFASAAVLLALFFFAWRGALVWVAGVLAVGLALIGAGELASGPGALLLAERSALPFLPFSALLLAGAPTALGLAAGGGAAIALALNLPSLTAPSPGELLARVLTSEARRGRKICAVGLWGPELDYRLWREGAPNAVVLFPSAVRFHPGWYREEDLDQKTLVGEATMLMASPSSPRLFVLPHGSRASAAILVALRPLHPRLLLSSPLVDVVGLR